ncbi:hypothetical protein [Geomicrobium sediminis]|uniref:Flagellar motility protein MotE (MotC chaperone) n=1 Tax=Geomicrobium sediminis TaxID=1347788 RepID=A0ABS2PAN6_9BACL|nr:hypothetical protein [Geomicrobium sediminis]MBM7632454.1 flagellar motility protein MotE (MotC chaperone) [Geomicrobium sediminis]
MKVFIQSLSLILLLSIQPYVEGTELEDCEVDDEDYVCEELDEEEILEDIEEYEENEEQEDIVDQIDESLLPENREHDEGEESIDHTENPEETIEKEDEAPAEDEVEQEENAPEEDDEPSIEREVIEQEVMYETMNVRNSSLSLAHTPMGDHTFSAGTLRLETRNTAYFYGLLNLVASNEFKIDIQLPAEIPVEQFAQSITSASIQMGSRSRQINKNDFIVVQGQNKITLNTQYSSNIFEWLLNIIGLIGRDREVTLRIDADLKAMNFEDDLLPPHPNKALPFSSTFTLDRGGAPGVSHRTLQTWNSEIEFHDHDGSLLPLENGLPVIELPFNNDGEPFQFLDYVSVRNVFTGELSNNAQFVATHNEVVEQDHLQRPGDYGLKVGGKDQSGTSLRVKEAIIRVKPGNVYFENVPMAFNFGDVPVNDQSAIHTRQQGHGHLNVVDETGEHSPSWRVHAALEKPLTSMLHSEVVLPEAIVFVNKNKEKTVLSNSSILVYKPTHNGVEHPIQWQIDEGVLLQTAPHQRVGSFEGSVRWTLVNAP